MKKFNLSPLFAAYSSLAVLIFSGLFSSSIQAASPSHSPLPGDDSDASENSFCQSPAHYENTILSLAHRAILLEARRIIAGQLHLPLDEVRLSGHQSLTPDFQVRPTREHPLSQDRAIFPATSVDWITLTLRGTYQVQVPDRPDFQVEYASTTSAFPFCTEKTVQVRQLYQSITVRSPKIDLLRVVSKTRLIQTDVGSD